MQHEIVGLKQPGTCTDLFSTLALLILFLAPNLIPAEFLNGVTLPKADMLLGWRAVEGNVARREEENDGREAMEEKEKGEESEGKAENRRPIRRA